MRTTKAGLAGIILGIALLPVAGQEPSPHEAVVREMLTSLEKVGATMATVLDRETADAAVPELRKRATAWVELRKKAKDLPPPELAEKERLAKDYRPKLNEAIKKIYGEVARVQAIPGGRAVVQEVRPILTRSDE